MAHQASTLLRMADNYAKRRRGFKVDSEAGGPSRSTTGEIRLAAGNDGISLSGGSAAEDGLQSCELDEGESLPSDVVLP